MARKDELLTLNEIAKLAGVGRQAAQKWHQVARKTGGEPPLRLVAKAMGVKVPEANDESPRYPRKVVVAFLKAVGYMNEDESLMERRAGKGKWAPAKPTIDPRPVKQPDPDSGEKPFKVDPQTGGRYRYYNPHAWELAGFGSENSFTSSRTLGRAPEPDGIDELERPYWFAETLEQWKAGAPERKALRYAGRQPDGFTPEGQPFRLLPGDNYYAKKATGQTDDASQDEPSEEG
jgi:transcriptional regulator with XRE-family HTH domain